jgi:hypothetical protein
MTNNNDKKLEEMLLSLDPKQKKQCRELLDSAISDDDILESQKTKEKLEIKKFEDKRVIPYDKPAVYDVFNKKNNVTTVMNGMMIVGLFGADTESKKAFENKLLGDTHTVNGYRIKFRHFETYK